jgi:hypothetical protein
MNTFRGCLRSFAADTSGGAVVEFALLAPILVLLLVASFELAIMLLVGSSLEAAVLSASRYGITGAAGSGGVSREDRIRAIIGERTFGLVDLGGTSIETLVYPSFGDIGRPERFTDANGNGSRDPGEPYTDTNGNGEWDEDMGRAGSGDACEIVLYVVSYDSGPVTHLLGSVMPTITHRATVAVRNEPFGGDPC